MQTTASLSDAALGAALRVREMTAPPQEATRLRALGICVGRTLRMVQPGDPLVVEVSGSRVAIAAALAKTILVVPSELPS